MFPHYKISDTFCDFFFKRDKKRMKVSGSFFQLENLVLLELKYFGKDLLKVRKDE